MTHVLQLMNHRLNGVNIVRLLLTIAVYVNVRTLKMKIGLEVKIDVKKIEKMRLYVGGKGTYLTMTTFIDTDNIDNYGNHGFISHKAKKDEERTPILGNCKVFWTNEEEQEPAPEPQKTANLDDFDEDEIPF